MAFEDKAHALSGSSTCTFHADAIAASEEFRKSYESRLNVVKAVDMPWERSPDGLIKHLVHHKLNTRECCVEAYMQFLKPGERSVHHPPAFRHRGRAADHDEQPHRQGDGIRLVRPGGESAGVLTLS
jgi:hypothetical protein